MGDYYDLHVPIWNNYLAEGLVNHNSGKTVIACRKLLRLMDLFPGYRVVIARRRWVHLMKTTLATFFKVCKPALYSDGRRSDSEKILRLNNGSEVLWMHLDDEEVANIIPGLEINALFIDQAEEVEEELYDRISARLGRWDQAEVPTEFLEQYEASGKKWKWRNPAGKVIPPAYSIIACNPDNELHWIYRRFHPESDEHFIPKVPEYDHGNPPKPTGKVMSYHDLGYKMITMASTTNRFLTKQNIAALLVQDESFQKRYVRGEWGSPEGTIHEIHPSSLVPGTQALVDMLVRTCKLHRTMDYGDSAPTAVLWWAVDSEGNSICYREYYVPDRLISEHRRELHRLSRDCNGVQERYGFNLADPSIFNKMPQAKGGRWCVADEYSNVKYDPQTPIFWAPADNNELGTRNRINEYLRIDPNRKNPFTGELGAPRLYFLTRTPEYELGCYQSVRQLRAQRRVRLGTDLGKPTFTDERDENVTDHAYDCTSGATKVLTPEGWTPISEMPEDGVCMTPSGWARYAHCQKYRENAEVVGVVFEDGRTVTTTPDHLFLTPEGWTRADELTNKTVCDTMPTWTQSSFPKPPKSLMASRTTSAASTFSEMVFDSIALSGQMLTGQSRAISTSTIAMRIGQTTASPIWSALTGRVTYPSTAKASPIPRLWQQCKQQLRRGMEVLRDSAGIESTTKNTWRSYTPEMSKSSASFAGSGLPQPESVDLERSIAGRTVVPRDSVRQIRVTTVNRKPLEDVYCLTVENEDAAFCVEGGLVIHNCVRYHIASRPPVAAVAPVQLHHNSFSAVRARVLQFHKYRRKVS